MRYGLQLVGTFGAVLIGVGGNAVFDDNAKKAAVGAWFLVVGIIFGTGGLIPLTYLFVRDYRSELTATIRGARLVITENPPLNYAFRLFVELIITPPIKHNLLFISDDIKARLDGLVEHPFPIENSNCGISPSTNPRIADGTYAELTIVRDMGVLCDGVLNLTTNVPLTLPSTLFYDLELIDASRDWMVVVTSELHRVSDMEYGGFPDREVPAPERFEDKFIRWTPFAMTATVLVAILAWATFTLITKGYL